MIKPYQRGDKNFKVKRTKDGRFEVYDSTKNFGDEGYIAAIFDANEEQDAFEAAENLNKQNDENFTSTLKTLANLSKELRSNLKESCTQYMDSLIEENLRDWFKPHIDKRTGKKFKGWINCRTGGPCSSKSKGNKYPACRPTHQQCKKIKGKMHKKTSSKRVKWKE